MPLTSIIEDSFNRSFKLYRDLVDSLDEATLSSNLAPLPSNTVGLQLWCVVGARESFAAAIAANVWSGFACSMQSTTEKTSVSDALDRSANAVSEILTTIDSYSDAQNRMIIDLLEHETAHQGQLIRYLYGLELTIPASWKSRYALE